MREYVGTITLGNKVDITDPCYNEDVWCRMTSECQQGEYAGYVDTFDFGGLGIRISSISIYKDDIEVPLGNMTRIGEIGVDAGLAGFFNEKQDFTDEEWGQLCDEINSGHAWCLDNPIGIFSDSGYGDGSYEVYANAERSAFTIVFIDDFEEN